MPKRPREYNSLSVAVKVVTPVYFLVGVKGEMALTQISRVLT
jgi:hypothetical protein